jgi:hypothetical protein
VYCKDEETDVEYRCGTYYVREKVIPTSPESPIDMNLSYSFVKETIDSNESSYQWNETNYPYGWYNLVRKYDENPIDFSKYRVGMTLTSVEWIGDKIE